MVGAWLLIPVASLLNIYSEMYQMLPRKGFVSFQVPRCSCRRGWRPLKGSHQCDALGSAAML